MSDEHAPPRAPTPEEKQQQKRRNLAIGLTLAAFVIVIFVVTILRLGASVADRPF